MTEKELNTLLAYQEKDKGLREIEQKLASSDERKKLGEAVSFLKHVEENLAKLESTATELCAVYDNAVKQREELFAQEKEFENAVKDVEDEGAGNYIMKKLDELLSSIRSLSAEIDRVFVEMQKVLKDYANLKNKNKEMRAQYTEFGEKYKGLEKSMADDKQKITAELDKLKKDIPADIMEIYEKKRRDKIYPILFEANGDFCGACNTELPLSVIQRLKNGEIIVCDQCGRLIYKK